MFTFQHGHKNCAIVARPSLCVLVMQYIQRCELEWSAWFTRLVEDKAQGDKSNLQLDMEDPAGALIQWQWMGWLQL